MVSRTVNLDDSQYQYIMNNGGEEGQFSRRVRELVQIGIEYEKDAQE
jgi:hypothetical protein